MEAYSSFAEVYDLFMDNVPYEEWYAYLHMLLEEYGIKEGLVLELGCGTGKMTRLLADHGYDMIGLDLSEEMLSIASENTKPEQGILYLCQDMREFELYGSVRAIVSICDSVNYILEEEDLKKVFSLVHTYLDPGGVFIFDLNTIYKYETILGETTICENRAESSFIWDNYYDEESGINEYDLTLFIKEEKDLYRKYEEIHYQRGYDLKTIETLIKEAGLTFVTMYDAFTKEPPKEDSERVYVIARKEEKKEENICQII